MKAQRRSRGIALSLTAALEGGWGVKGKNTHTAERSGAARSGQQLVIQFVQTNRPLCLHELNHKLLAAPLCVCFYPKATADRFTRGKGTS